EGRPRAPRAARRAPPGAGQARTPPPKASRDGIPPDSHFIAAPHPEHPTVWLVGGGSGHGFKHGPAMAERLVTAWRGGTPLPPRFALGERKYAASLRSAGSNLR